MSVTATSIPATDLTKRAADKPLVVGRNLLELAYATAAANMVWNTSGTLAAGDASASGINGRDVLQMRRRHRLWKFGSSVATVYGCIDMGSTLLDTDTFVIDLPNFAGATYKVEADSTTPSGDPWGTTIFSGTVASANTILLLHASTMYQARYWRIKFTNGSPLTYQAAGIWLGKAIQFLNKAEIPWAPTIAGVAAGVDVETAGGVATTYRTSDTTITRDLRFKVAGVYQESGATTDPETFLANFYDFWTNTNSIRGGTKPFWYCENPTANPNGAKLMRSLRKDLPFVQTGPQETDFPLSMREQGAG